MPAEDYWNSFFDSNCVLSELECSCCPGDVVEFGCGYGLFTEAVAKTAKGNVYALDIDPAMVAATRNRTIQFNNVQVELRDFVGKGCGRPDQSASYAMLFNILHFENPADLLGETFRVTTPGGTLGTIHWNYDASTPRGPSLDIRPKPEQCQRWIEQAGFQNIQFKPLACCPHHYGIVAQRPL